MKLRTLARHAYPCIGALAVARTAAAASERPSYALSWSRAEEARACIGDQALARKVEERLGRAVFVSPAAAELSLEGRIERTPGGWSAVISVYDHDGQRLGQRELSSGEQDCRALDRPLSLMLALTIDPGAALAEPDSGRGDVSPAPAPTSFEPPVSQQAPRPAADPTQEPYPRPPRPTSAAPHVEIAVRLAFGILPQAAVPGGHAAAVVPIHGNWVARIGATAWPPARAIAEEGGAFFSLFSATVAACQRQVGASTLFLMCAGAEPGVLAQAPYGFNRRSRAAFDATLIIAAGGRAAIRLWGPLWGQIGGDVLVPIIRDQFYYSRSDETTSDVFRMAPVGAAADGGLLLAFP
jgi:hypothetical protein